MSETLANSLGFVDNARMTALLSCIEFARMQKLSEQRVRQLLAAGKVEGAIRVGARWAIPRNAHIMRRHPGRPPRRRESVLRQAARACAGALARAGVEVRVVGSVAYGAVRPASDLDLLIIAYPGKSWAQVRSMVDEAAQPYDIPVDVIFADTLPPAVRKALLKDARRAREL